MQSVHVDPQRAPHAPKGASWGDDHETRAFGQATTGGVMGSYGLSCDKLLSVDIVTADGKLLKAAPARIPTASEGERQRQFWRGDTPSR